MIGYARVSTTGQALSAQIDQLKAAGCTTIFQETVSGARSDRPQLDRAVASLTQDEALVVTRLDRLARSTRDLLNIIARIEAAGGRFKSTADGWADTTTPTGRLLLTLLGGLSEFERSLIKDRTTEGRNRAVKAERKLDRKPLLTTTQETEALRLADEGKSHAEIGRVLRVSRSTISRFLARRES